MREPDSIIDRRISYNDDREKDLTKNKEYIILDERRHPRFEWSIESILLLNDQGTEKWYFI